MLDFLSRSSPGRTSQVESPKTFLLGVGAQKGGTSWLHDHLARSEQSIAGYRKEFHVFDVLDLPGEQWKRDNIARLARREGRRAVAGEPLDATNLHRAAMLYDTDFYFDYFTGLLGRDPAYRLTMDMTPDYAMLSGERLRSIRAEFGSRGIRTASVFLMRDPVERIWSHIRMEKSRRPQRLTEDSAHYVLERHADPIYAGRTRYDRTLAALDEALPAADTYIGFYEQLFTVDAVDAIEALVGVKGLRPTFDVRVNASTRTSEQLPADTVRVVAQHFAPVYREVAARFPHLDLPALWPSAAYLG